MLIFKSFLILYLEVIESCHIEKNIQFIWLPLITLSLLETRQKGSTNKNYSRITFLFGIKLLSNRIMTNLLVRTTNSDELARMEQEYQFRDGYFHVPAQDSFTLEALFRAVSFEYFQNSPPQIAQKIMTLTQNSVSRIFSLDLFREIMQIVSITLGKLALYRQYFIDINRQIRENMDSGLILMSEFAFCSNQDNDKVFALAQMGEMRMTRHLEMDLFQECDLKLKNCPPIQFSEKTQLPQSRKQNPQESSHNFQENTENNISQIFYSAQSYYGNNEWWKQQNHANDSSKEISKFDCKVGTPLHQKSIGGLVIQELKYDLKRKIEIGKDIIKHQQDPELGKYKKMMKEKLLTAKLKKKKKK